MAPVDRTVMLSGCIVGLVAPRSLDVNPEHKKGSILNSAGEIVAGPPDSSGDLNLPPGVQALIEARVTQARSEISDSVRAEFVRFADAKSRFWQRLSVMLSVVTFAVAIFNWYFSKERVMGLVDDWSATHLVEGPLRVRVDAILAEKGEVWAADKFAPLSEKTSVLAGQIVSLSTEIGEQQATLRSEQARLFERTDILNTQIAGLSAEIHEQQEKLRVDQQRLRDQVEIQELAVAARIGESSSWGKLCEIAGRDSASSKIAGVAKLEVEQFYIAERYLPVGHVPIDSLSKKTIQFPLEEALETLFVGDTTMRKCAANELAELKIKSSVAAVCDAIAKESDLLVLGRLTRALEKITEVRFDPLAREAVAEWWRQNKARPEFRFPWDEYARNRRFFMGQATPRGFWREVNPSATRAVIPELVKIAEAEPKAALTRYYLCLARSYADETEAAEKDLRELESSTDSRRYWRVPVLRAIVATKKGERVKAIEALNTAFELAPANASKYAREMAVFRVFENEPDVKWPARDATQSELSETEER